MSEKCSQFAIYLKNVHNSLHENVNAVLIPPVILLITIENALWPKISKLSCSQSCLRLDFNKNKMYRTFLYHNNSKFHYLYYKSFSNYTLFYRIPRKLSFLPIVMHFIWHFDFKLHSTLDKDCCRFWSADLTDQQA